MAKLLASEALAGGERLPRPHGGFGFARSTTSSGSSARRTSTPWPRSRTTLCSRTSATTCSDCPARTELCVPVGGSRPAPGSRFALGLEPVTQLVDSGACSRPFAQVRLSLQFRAFRIVTVPSIPTRTHARCEHCEHGRALTRSWVGFCVLRASGGPVDLDRYGLRVGSRVDQVKRNVRAGAGEQPRALAEDHGDDEQVDLVDEVVSSSHSVSGDGKGGARGRASRTSSPEHSRYAKLG